MKHVRHLALACLITLGAPGLAAASEPIDINTATAEMLAAAMDGVGARRAQAIIEHREQHGPFSSVDELQAVRGIGPKLLEGSRSRLTVD